MGLAVDNIDFKHQININYIKIHSGAINIIVRRVTTNTINLVIIMHKAVVLMGFNLDSINCKDNLIIIKQGC